MNAYATIMAENANGIDFQIVERETSPQIKNVFATLKAAGGKRQKRLVWSLKMRVTALEDSSHLWLREIQFLVTLQTTLTTRTNGVTANAQKMFALGIIGMKVENLQIQLVTQLITLITKINGGIANV